MTRSLLLCLLQAIMGVIHAQGFDTHWISAPIPDSTSHLWFRQTYLSRQRPEVARITVATTGCFKLYVNECIVGTALHYPARHDDTGAETVTTFDVTAYLRPDTNVIAILYAPSFPHIDTRQLSVTYRGTYRDGRPFSHASDGNWLCKTAGSRSKADGGETIDGRKHDTSWRSTQFDAALWLNAREQPAPASTAPTVRPDGLMALQTVRRRPPVHIETAGDSVYYDFGTAFIGQVRLTLRNARRGQRIRIDNTDYICNGELDEQAYPAFAVESHRRVLVCGDRRFARDLIFDIEAIETATTWLPFDGF